MSDAYECTNCGAVVGENAKFCSGCGASFEKKRRGALFWVAIVTGVLAVAGVFGGIAANNGSQPAAGPPLSPPATMPAHARATPLQAVIADCGKPQKTEDEAGSPGLSDIHRVTYGNTELEFYRDSPADPWIFGSAFAVGDDDVMSAGQASKRMACVKGGLRDLGETTEDSESPSGQAASGPSFEQKRAGALSKLSKSAQKVCDDHPTYDPDVCGLISERKIWIGLPDTQARLTVGSPEIVNTTRTQSGKVEQWVYGIGNYVYVEGGVVTSLQTSR